MSTNLSFQTQSTLPCPSIDYLTPVSSYLRDVRQITYGEVIKFLEESVKVDLRLRGKSLKRVRNLHSVITDWMKRLELSELTPVGVEFGSEFTKCMNGYLCILEAEGKTRQTIADRSSILGKYREAWLTLLEGSQSVLPEGDFAQVLNALVEESGRGTEDLAIDCGVDRRTLGNWRKGRSLPHKKLLPAVNRLEEIFGLPCGALVAKLPRVLHGMRGPDTRLTGYRQHLAKMSKLRYILKDYPAILQSEWDKLFLFYTDAAWLRTHGLKRNSKWRVREHDNRCPTAEKVRLQMSKFFGYLCLPPDSNDPHTGGLGYQAEGLTLGLLSDSDLIYSFLQYKKERTYLKRYNSDTRSFLEFCLAILRPDTGFLWQLPEMGERLPIPVPKEEWHAWCERHRAVIKATLKDLVRENEIKKTRDPFEPIRSIIINNQHPLDVLFEMADDYEADCPPQNVSQLTKSLHYQNVFLIRFATLIPLRQFNISIMTYRTDNTGNLYQKPDGSWWVRFEPEYMKNHRGAAKDVPFDVPLHKSLWSYVENFLFVHRPRLTGATVCDYVFRPGIIHIEGKEYEPVSKHFLSEQIYKISQQYIPGCPGFCLHAFRHLVATEYIKNNPAGYAVAAAILHDREETVKKNYAWVLPADKFGFWNEYVSRLIARVEEGITASEEVTK